MVACIVAVQSEFLQPALCSGCSGLAEYRLDELSRVSGVSARNIRAYRERGLLDPPRREGRSAYYDDYHLAQLKTINQLLRKGFNSAHIAEFFASLRGGADLADNLGIQRAILGPRSAGAPTAAAVDLDPGSEEARKLLDLGLAELVDGAVVLVDRAMGETVARAPDQLLYIRAILGIVESARATIDELATEVLGALEESFMSRFGPNYLPRAEETTEFSQILQDFRDLGGTVVAYRLDKALQQQIETGISEITAQMLLRGQLEPKRR